MAKILGKLASVSGAISTTLLKGRRLLNRGESMFTSESLLGLPSENWLLGCLFLLEVAGVGLFG